MDDRTDEPQSTASPEAATSGEEAPVAPRRRASLRGAVISVLGMAFAVNMILSYEWGWEVTPSEVLANEPRVGLSKRSEGRYLVVEGRLVRIVYGSWRGVYAVFSDAGDESKTIAAYFADDSEATTLGFSARPHVVSGRVASLPAEAASAIPEFEGRGGVPCLVAGSGRFRSWHFLVAVIIIAWGAAILARSVRGPAAPAAPAAPADPGRGPGGGAGESL